MENLERKIREAYQKAPYQILSTIQLAELGEFDHIIKLRKEMYGDGKRIICGSVGYSELTLAEIGEDGWLRPAQEKEDRVFVDARTKEELSLGQAIQRIKKGFPITVIGNKNDEVAVELICYEQ